MAPYADRREAGEHPGQSHAAIGGMSERLADLGFLPNKPVSGFRA
jgi:hypothetical protein